MRRPQFTLKQLHDVVGGSLSPPSAGARSADEPTGQVVTDSRKVEPGDVFWALKGADRNGADFTTDAYRRGAVGVVSDERRTQPCAGRWTLCVDDAQQALWQLAAWKREQFTGTVVAVTGSVGKTTCRQMIDTLLRSRLTGTSSPHNYNNHIGLPLSMLNLAADEDYAVFELGANAPGEIGRLARLCAPEIGVITCLGDAHLGRFGGHRAIAQSKTELLAALPRDGRAILGGDDPLLRAAAAGVEVPTMFVGRGVDCDLVATDIESVQGQVSFSLDGHRLHVPVWGRHHVASILAAVAVARTFGLTFDEIAGALATFNPLPMRCQVFEQAGVTIINDSYNSSPLAMRAALDMLHEMECRGRRVVVCGDMRELGPAAEQWHRRVGDQVVSLGGADLLIGCGDHADDVASGALAAGMPSSKAMTCRDSEEASTMLSGTLKEGDVVLIKGSRAMAMERVVEKLENELAQRSCCAAVAEV